LGLSAIDGHAAAIFLALGEFVFSPRLDIDRLRRAATAQAPGTVARAAAQYRAPPRSPAGGKRPSQSGA
jgi:hypothetical protein